MPKANTMPQADFSNKSGTRKAAPGPGKSASKSKATTQAAPRKSPRKAKESKSGKTKISSSAQEAEAAPRKSARKAKESKSGKTKMSSSAQEAEAAPRKSISKSASKSFSKSASKVKESKSSSSKTAGKTTTQAAPGKAKESKLEKTKMDSSESSPIVVISSDDESELDRGQFDRCNDDRSVQGGSDVALKESDVQLRSHRSTGSPANSVEGEEPSSVKKGEEPDLEAEIAVDQATFKLVLHRLFDVMEKAFEEEEVKDWYLLITRKLGTDGVPSEEDIKNCLKVDGDNAIKLVQEVLGLLQTMAKEVAKKVDCATCELDWPRHFFRRLSFAYSACKSSKEQQARLTSCPFCSKTVGPGHLCVECNKQVHVFCGEKVGEEGHGAKIICFGCRPASDGIDGTKPNECKDADEGTNDKAPEEEFQPPEGELEALKKDDANVAKENGRVAEEDIKAAKVGAKAAHKDAVHRFFGKGLRKQEDDGLLNAVLQLLMPLQPFTGVLRTAVQESKNSEHSLPLTRALVKLLDDIRRADADSSQVKSALGLGEQLGGTSPKEFYEGFISQICQEVPAAKKFFQHLSSTYHSCNNKCSVHRWISENSIIPCDGNAPWREINLSFKPFLDACPDYKSACKDCATSGKHVVNFMIEEAPPIIVLHLDNSPANQGRGVAAPPEEILSFPIRDSVPENYDVCGIVLRAGRQFYSVGIRSDETLKRSWARFDDDLVTPADMRKLQGFCMAMYVRRKTWHEIHTPLRDSLSDGKSESVEESESALSKDLADHKNVASHASKIVPLNDSKGVSLKHNKNVLSHASEALGEENESATPSYFERVDSNEKHKVAAGCEERMSDDGDSDEASDEEEKKMASYDDKNDESESNGCESAASSDEANNSVTSGDETSDEENEKDEGELPLDEKEGDISFHEGERGEENDDSYYNGETDDATFEGEAFDDEEYNVTSDDCDGSSACGEERDSVTPDDESIVVSKAKSAERTEDLFVENIIAGVRADLDPLISELVGRIVSEVLENLASKGLDDDRDSKTKRKSNSEKKTNSAGLVSKKASLKTTIENNSKKVPKTSGRKDLTDTDSSKSAGALKKPSKYLVCPFCSTTKKKGKTKWMVHPDEKEYENCITIGDSNQINDQIQQNFKKTEVRAYRNITRHACFSDRDKVFWPPLYGGGNQADEVTDEVAVIL